MTLKYALLVSALLWALLLLTAWTLIGCGGGGDDDEDTYSISEQVTPQPTPPPTNITCYHNGTIWSCAADNSCIHDQSTEEEVAYMEEASNGALRVMFTSGNITIINQCGSNSTFNVTESTVEVVPNEPA